MMRVGLLRLPFIPLGFLLVFLEFGAVPAASETIHLDTSTALQAEVDLRQPAAGATTPAEVEPSNALSRDNPPAAIKSSAAQKMPLRKSPSILQMLEGHEQDLWIGVSIAVVFFLVGWISGGNYYVRRERRRRTKLNF